MSFDWSRYSVLIVEDDLEMLGVLCDLFKKKGLNVFSAGNGKEALAICEKEFVHLVLSDVQMPVMGGKELLLKIRERNPEIPIVFLATGQAQLTEEEALKAGAAGLIHKPFQIRVLFEKIQHIFEEYKKNNKEFYN